MRMIEGLAEWMEESNTDAGQLSAGDITRAGMVSAFAECLEGNVDGLSELGFDIHQDFEDVLPGKEDLEALLLAGGFDVTLLSQDDAAAHMSMVSTYVE